LLYEEEECFTGTQVRAGTIEGLIRALTPENYYDANFVFTFLLTYHHFTTSEMILELLKLRWRMPGERDLLVELRFCFSTR